MQNYAQLLLKLGMVLRWAIGRCQCTEFWEKNVFHIFTPVDGTAQNYALYELGIVLHWAIETENENEHYF